MVIDERGIVEAIRFLVAKEHVQSELEVHFQHDVGFDRLDPLLEGTLFRIVQEALNNVKRHSGVAKAEVQLVQSRDLLLIVRDQGCGFDPEAVPEDRYGVRGMCERARLFGGAAVVNSRVGQGTCVEVRLPLTDSGLQF
jgi:two-component system sensor histidine kinase DegS